MTTIAVYPGTFDPIHMGHVDIARRASSIFDDLIVAVYDRPAKSLMFDIDERVELARQALANLQNVRVTPYNSLTADYAQQVGAQAIVRGLRVVSDFELEYQMALTNRQLAPDIEVVCLMTHQAHAFLSSGIVKEISSLGGDVTSMVPPEVAKALERKRRELKDKREPAPIVSLRD
ncbi:MAG: pantetheine-phosphate adenylyltransferase [Anaerolineales bacterium]|nr:MAG: pantetheine-phosphate adenylyltransferase [Anaerolineales bacterium]